MTTARDVSTTFESEVAAAFPCLPDGGCQPQHEIHVRRCRRYAAMNLARAVAARVRREASACHTCVTAVKHRADCPSCSGTGIAWGKA